MMGPTNPQEFLMKAGKAIDMERKAQRRPRVMKDAREPVSLTDIYRTEPLPRMTPSGGNGNYRGNNFNTNYHALKQGNGRERSERLDGYQSYTGGFYDGTDRSRNRPFGRQNFNQIGGSRNYANNNSRGNQLGNYPQNRENGNNYQNSTVPSRPQGSKLRPGGTLPLTRSKTVQNGSLVSDWSIYAVRAFPSTDWLISCSNVQSTFSVVFLTFFFLHATFTPPNQWNSQTIKYFWTAAHRVRLTRERPEILHPAMRTLPSEII